MPRKRTTKEQKASAWGRGEPVYDFEPTYWVSRVYLQDNDRLYLGNLERARAGGGAPGWATEGGWVGLYEIEHSAGSDYSGGTVTRSNYEVLLEMAGDEHPELVPFYGGHGSYGMLVRHDKPLTEEVAEAIDSLEDYPLLDEDHHSHLEMDARNDQWNDWGRKDWQRELQKAFDESYEDIIDELSDEDLDELWESVAQNLSWETEFETGGLAVFNFDEAIKKLPDNALDKYAPENRLRKNRR